MRWRRNMGALALSSLLAAADAPPSARDPADPPPLAERIDLTRITVLQADYTRAAKERNATDLAANEREIVAMLRDEVLPYARVTAPRGTSEEGAGSGTAALGRGATATPAVAVDEEEVGAAALEAQEAQVVATAREFISLEGKSDDASLMRKVLLTGSLQAMSEAAHYSSQPDAARAREMRERTRQEARDREAAEGLPAK